jgi:ABC-2 type transport system ATP-binding protein
VSIDPALDGSPLACRGLTKRFGDRLAVDHVDLRLARGEIFALLGPNGAGKTTTVRMLCGLIEASEGEAFVTGVQVDRDDSFRSRIGTLPETPGLYERLSAMVNLEYFARLHGLETARWKARAEELLRGFGLWDRRDDAVAGFSKGMKQKVAIARALLHEPDVLFLDEPTSGLDPEASVEVRHMIRSLKARGTTVLLTTHRLEEAEDLADRVGILRTRLLAVDTVENLRHSLYGRKVLVRVGDRLDEIAAFLPTLPFVRETVRRERPLGLEVTLEEPDRDVPELVRALVARGAQVRAVQDVHYSLEQMYLDLLRRAA